MRNQCIRYLQYLSRNGLDARVLQEYRQCGMLYCSKRYDSVSADISRFVDFEGFDRKLIRKVSELENKYSVSVFHIIKDNDDTLFLMCHDPDIDEDYQFEEFTIGKCNAIKYCVDTDTSEYTEMNYEVRLGSVVDIDFMNNM